MWEKMLPLNADFLLLWWQFVENEKLFIDSSAQVDHFSQIGKGTDFEFGYFKEYTAYDLQFYINAPDAHGFSRFIDKDEVIVSVYSHDFSV